MLDETVFETEIDHPIITREKLREAMETMRKYQTGKARFEQRCIENENWWMLRHWREIKERGTTTLETKSAWLINVILSKHADAMDAYPEPSFLAREQADEGEAKMLSSVVPVIMKRSDFEKTWSDNWYKKLRCGVAIYGVFWDKDLLNGLGDIAIRKIDPLQLYWEPGITNLQDSQNVFHVTMEDNEKLEERYPELKGKLSGLGFTPKKYQTSDHVDNDNRSAVVDWYYKKRIAGKTVLHYAKFVNEFVLYSTEEDNGEEPVQPETSYSGIQEPMRWSGEDQTAPTESMGAPEDPLIRSFGAPSPPGEGFGQQEEPPSVRGLYDHGLYPFFVDVLFPEEGTITGFGYIDICKDPQRQIDLMNNAIVANAIASATPRWFKRGNDGINEQEFADWSKPFVHVDGNLEDSNMRQIVVNPLAGNYLNILQSKINEMKETSGNRDVNNGGAAAGVTAASAFAILAENSGKLSRDMEQSTYNVYTDMQYCVLALIRQFYTFPRTFRILGENGMAEYVQFSNQGLVPQPQGGDAFGVSIDLRQPEFDIEVAAARQSSYSKLSYNELAIQFFQLGFFNPELSDQALAAMEMMDFKGKDKIKQRIAQNGGMLQMIQQLQMQVQQLSEMLGIMPQGGGPEQAAQPRQGGGGKLVQTDNLGNMKQQSTIVEKAQNAAQQATQPQ